MNFKQLLQKLIPHATVIIFFYLLTSFIFRPMIFEGKDFYQHDIYQGIGKNRQVLEYLKENGEQALWNNAMFSGAPEFFALRFNENVYHFFAKVLSFGFSAVPAKVFYCLVGAYIMLLTFNIRPLFAAMGALVFALCGFNIIGLVAGHNSRIQAIAFLPIIIGGINYAFNANRSIGAILVLLGLGLQIRANHLQMTYYTLLITLILGLVYLLYAFKEKKLNDFLKTIGVLSIAAIISVGANFGKLWAVYEYGQYSTRGKNELAVEKGNTSGLDKGYAFHYSNGIFEPLVMFLPHILGGSSTEELAIDSNLGEALRRGGYNRTQARQQLQRVPTYWGNQPLTAPYYLSAIAIFLFVLSFFYLNRKEKSWIYAVIVLGIMLSWGSNFAAFNNFLFDHLPGYNKFRSVTFTILLPVTGIIIAAFLALERFVVDNSGKKVKKLLIAATGTAGFAVFIILISGAFSYNGSIDSQFPDWYLDALKQDRRSLLIKDALKATFIICIGAGVLVMVARERLNIKIGAGLLALMVFIEMFSATTSYINSSRFTKNAMSKEINPTAADQLILNNVSPGGRVLNLQNPFNEATTSYFHESLGGYHGAKLGRYQDIIDRHLQLEMQQVIDKLRNQSINFADCNVLNMLNTEYIKFGDDRNSVVSNVSAQGTVWSVSELIPVTNGLEEIESIREIDIQNQAVMDESFRTSQLNYQKGSIDLVSRNNNRIEYSSNSDDTMFAVFSEVFYPKGWNVTIDGKASSMLRVNYLLRGLEIPKGAHSIVFSFEPKSYFVGKNITLVSSFFVIVFIGLALFFEWRRGSSLFLKSDS